MPLAVHYDSIPGNGVFSITYDLRHIAIRVLNIQQLKSQQAATVWTLILGAWKLSRHGTLRSTTYIMSRQGPLSRLDLCNGDLMKPGRAGKRRGIYRPRYSGHRPGPDREKGIPARIY